MAAPEHFGRNRRLRLPAEFHRVFQRRCSVSDSVLIVYGVRNERGAGRLGLSVGKRVGSAPQRNRWKRLIRESFRRQPQAAAGLDLVVIPRPGAPCDYTTVSGSLLKLIRRLQRRLNQQA